MKVVLKKDFGKLGYKDDIVTVKNGYGLNYLIPNGIADFATTANIKTAAENRKQSQKKIERLRGEALAVVEVLEKSPIELSVKLSKDGALLQKITAKTILEALSSKSDYNFQKDSITLKNKMDKVGSYEVSVKLYRDVVADVKVILKTE